MRRFLLSTTFVTLAAAACSDNNPTGALRASDAGGPLANQAPTESLSDYIDRLIAELGPPANTRPLAIRWTAVKARKSAGDIPGATKLFMQLAAQIQAVGAMKTMPPGNPQERELKATRLVYAMSIWLFVGPSAPIPEAGGDSKVAIVPAGEAATVVTDTKRAGVDIEAGSTAEDRVIIVAQAETRYLGHCNGPLDTRLCQYPLFYKFESFPLKRLNKAGRFAVCVVTTGDRDALDYAAGDGREPKGEVHHRFRLAHDKPENAEDFTPGATVVDGIEILKKSAVQKGFTECDGPVDYAWLPDGVRGGWRGRAQRVTLAVMNFAGRLLTPRSLYAYDSGPEHESVFFSAFNTVDPESKPDLRPEGIMAPSEVVRGDVATIAYRVTNKSRRQADGNATAGSEATTATVYLVRDAEAEPVQVGPLCTAGEGEEELCAFAVRPLRPDEEQAMSEALVIPADVDPGQWFVEVRVAPSPSGEVDVANNVLRSSEPLTVIGSGGEVPDVLGTLASAYAQLRTTLWAYYNVSEISSDEMIVPTRGQDWYDNGRWLEMDRQAWTAGSGSAQEDINAAWVDAYTGIERANVVLGALPRATVPDKAVVEAEARTLRAFYYYTLIDMFGGVPIVTTTSGAPRPRSTRAELFQFIEGELTAARAALPISWPGGDYWRMTKGAADAILASMYVNAAVLSRDGSVSGFAYNSCQQVQVGGASACQRALDAADRILNSGMYSLAADWRSNFSANNHLSPENVLVVKHVSQPGLGLNFVMRSLHYAQHTPSAWNGFATIGDVYNAYDDNDQRKSIFLVGPQVNLDPQSGTYNQPVNDRSGAPLVFTPAIANVEQATEGEGARIMKWPIDPGHAGPDHGNDFAYFRLAEIYLIKAEALAELGRSGEALQLLNMLRSRVFEPDEPLAAISRDVILRERLFELTAEAKRRQDLIRHGRYAEAWQYKPARSAHVILMPIPAKQIALNPLLVQNPGY